MQIIKYVDRQPKQIYTYGYGDQEVFVDEKGRDVYFITEDINNETN